MLRVCSLRLVRGCCLNIVQGLNRAKDNLHTQLADLRSKKPRGRTDEALILEIERLKSTLVVARDDLVGGLTHVNVCASEPPTERHAAP